MVTFVTVFLALVVGVHPVELTVTGEVVSVELRLDGQSVGQLRGAPWQIDCDFGPELAPHELVAIGFDAAGREVARTPQWINLPQPRSQAKFVPVKTEGSSQMRLLWQSADGLAPDSWLLRFDGEPLAVDDPELFALPPHDPEKVHLLQAELHFGSSSAYAERIVGGQMAEVVDTELTALVFTAPGRDSPSASALQGLLTKNGKPLEVVATERGGSDIVMVQVATPRSWGKLLRIRKQAIRTRNAALRDPELTSGMHPGDSLYIVLPVATTGTAGLVQFPVSVNFAVYMRPESAGGERFIGNGKAEGVLATFPFPEDPPKKSAPRRVSDAVATAAQAASSNRRSRAVVLINDRDTEDVSENSPQTVRRYLQRLQVPLFVWSTERSEGPGEWGDEVEISSLRDLHRVVADLRWALDHQLVVWVRGRYLPQDIELAPGASALLTRVSAP